MWMVVIINLVMDEYIFKFYILKMKWKEQFKKLYIREKNLKII